MKENNRHWYFHGTIKGKEVYGYYCGMTERLRKIYSLEFESFTHEPCDDHSFLILEHWKTSDMDKLSRAEKQIKKLLKEFGFTEVDSEQYLDLERQASKRNY